MLERECEVALAIAAEVSPIARGFWQSGRDGLGATDKSDGSPVTLADTEVDHRVVERLREAFPSDAIVAEESARDPERTGASRCWFIDPIDGTRDFIAGDVNWAIHIGLCVDGRPMLGVVAEPGHGRTSWGIVGVGAWERDEHRTMALESGPSARLRMVSSQSHRTPRLDAVAEGLGVAPEHRLRMSSVGCKAAALIRGEAEVYAHPSLGTKLWDSCAPQALLEAAGGCMTDMRGRPLVYRGAEIENASGLLATAGIDHHDIVRRLAGLTGDWF